MDKHLSRRSFLKTSAVAASILALAACAPPAPTEGSGQVSESSSSVTGAPQKLVFASYTWSGYEAAMNQMIDAWVAQNPGVTVERIFTPWDDFWGKLQTMVASGTPPDVGIADYGRIVSYAKNGVILDITDLVQTSNFPLDKMLPAAVAQYRWAPGEFDTGAEDAALYGIPCDAQSQVMYYNKQMFDAAGVAYPTDDWTWDNVVEAAQQLTKPDQNQWGINIPPGLLPRGIFLWSAGGSWHSPDFKESRLDAPETIEAYKWVWDLIYTHKVAPVSPGGQTNPFLSGQVAMHVDGVWWVPDFATGMAEGSWDTCMFPKHPRTGKRTTSVESDGWWIFNGTREPDLSWSLVDFLSNRDGQAKFNELNYLVPSSIPEIGEEWYSRTPPENRGKILQNIVEDSQKVDITYFEAATILSVVSPVIDKAFADGEDITAALQAAARLMNDELVKAWELFNA